ncbi:MAG: DUF1972 domain-containing protein [Bacteroidales bacterium]|nr:DUF1972 domain-containing protein [Bacteroidales bacterium]
MRIAILGTRGIPNRYGGFERFAEVVSVLFAEQGHTVYVLSPGRSSTFNGVNVVSISVPRWLPANFQTLIYDLRSLIWASQNNVDIVLECGYSFAFWLFLFPKSFRRRVITNPDGLEFNRKKWNLAIKLFLRLCEYGAVKLSARIVCDNPELVGYYTNRFDVNPQVIPYGAFLVEMAPDKSLLQNYGIAGDYYLMVTRITPENSIGLILDCFSKTERQLIVVGNYKNKYGHYCRKRYAGSPNIKFLGGIYNQDDLNALRFYSKAYIHGHSVGGTNPSLLEAMACGCFVIAHDNPFNRYAMVNCGLYFGTPHDFMSQLSHIDAMPQCAIDDTKRFFQSRIHSDFNWNTIAEKYLEVFAALQ